MIALRKSTPEDGPRVVEIWRLAVDATHDFLTPEDRAAIDEQVQAFLPAADLWLAVDAEGRVVGFMGLSDEHMDSLFIDPGRRGEGIGRTLVLHALTRLGRLTTDVNEQNAQAVGFYERLGFVRVGRSPVDSDGRPYPLIHLRLEAGR
jgi:putative acetyltransferase